MVGIRSVADYSPFGVELDGRTQSNSGYRYSFQGQEKDDEIKGEGNSINYKYRMHDPRVGRFFAVDPLIKEYPFYSSYCFSGNRIIDAIELEGKEPVVLNQQIIGYRVKPGQGPSQIAEDINNVKTQKDYGFKLTLGSVNWIDIVIDNPKFFPKEIELDKNSIDFTSLNINPGDILYISGYNPTYEILLSQRKMYQKQIRESKEKMKRYNEEKTILERRAFKLVKEGEKIDKLVKQLDAGYWENGRKISSGESKYYTVKVGIDIYEYYKKVNRLKAEVIELDKNILDEEQWQETVMFKNLENEKTIKEVENGKP